MTVDLASKFSAVIVRDRGGKIHCQFDSSGMSAFSFAMKIARTGAEFNVQFYVIEDVPYGIASQAMTKPVTRLQGVLLLALHRVLDNVVFLNPSTWQKRYPGVSTAPKELSKTEKDKYRIEAAKQHAARLGYSAPDLVAQYIASLPEGTKVLKKNTNPLEKSQTDYVSAWLISDWVFSFDSYDEIRTLVGVQPPMI